ncbi:MAG: glycosyltransferase family 39 protein [candidate division NC10 bacterium]|nr:glycosyltransferase family 39 protein [candidate division NC10 bacterium]
MAVDSAVYFEMADFIRAGRWSDALAYPYPPLFPMLIAAVQWPARSAETAGLLIALAAGLLAIFPLVAIARTTAGETAAAGAAFLWAIHPLAIRLGVQALTDTPMVFFVAMAIWAGLRAMDENRLSWALGAGGCSGLAYLLRPEGIEPALALAVLYTRHGSPSSHADEENSTSSSARKTTSFAFGKKALRRVAWALAPLVGWAVIASPYIVHISGETGSLTLSKKKSTSSLLRSLAPVPEGATTSEGVVKSSGAPAGVNQLAPQGKLRRFSRSVYDFQKPLVNGIHPLVLLFGVLGAWGIRAQKARGSGRARALLLGLLGLHLVVLVGLAAHQGATYLGGHHFFLMVLYSLPFAGAGLASALTWGTDRLGGQRWVPIGAVALLVAVPIIWMATRGTDRGVMVRPAAAWIRSQVRGTPVIVTNIAKLTYHARAKRVELSGTYDEILQRGRAQSAHFVAFYPDLVNEVSPDFLPRLNARDLALARSFPEPSRDSPGQRLEIYRFRPK